MGDAAISHSRGSGFNFQLLLLLRRMGHTYISYLSISWVSGDLLTAYSSAVSTAHVQIVLRDIWTDDGAKNTLQKLRTVLQSIYAFHPHLA